MSRKFTDGLRTLIALLTVAIVVSFFSLAGAGVANAQEDTGDNGEPNTKRVVEPTDGCDDDCDSDVDEGQSDAANRLDDDDDGDSIDTEDETAGGIIIPDTSKGSKVEVRGWDPTKKEAVEGDGCDDNCNDQGGDGSSTERSKGKVKFFNETKGIRNDTDDDDLGDAGTDLADNDCDDDCNGREDDQDSAEAEEEKVERPEKPDLPERPEKIDRPERPDRPDRPDGT